MHLSQFLLLVLVTFSVCCSTLTSAEDPAQMKNSATAMQQASTRPLKGSKTTTDMTPADEERFTPNFRQYVGVFKLPSFSKLPLFKQLAVLKQKFGKGVDVAAKAWFKYLRNRNPKANM
ncbi:hypothetical protein PF005_g26388 [Phytophthora fragariae]|uniref:RxLR effector protein n=1 Tax=Phytophthora fragariae TaxID=53985 RepID=A0A6A3VTR8_9STRA|nr:hypothetical protein PF003_g25743 [Phytophthora fragariae]KAE8922655.1 hypothetical protein PF009_g27082 [Phytophthora fragariae]KAE8973333.1 hypothetical protein PF011_g25296 [Phytophthora fragariae]KAE9069607.1 hypothetical protein PF010_g26597 [Phytophthora fragariae]KAE9071798.1 hypothetical protein PF007_g26416 [Phytophthora fragariae]